MSKRYCSPHTTHSILAVVVLATLLVFPSATLVAQDMNPLPLGTVTWSPQEASCPAGEMNTTPRAGAVCYTATINNCTSGGIPSIDATVAVSMPSTGWNENTIVLLSGNDGSDYFGTTEGSGGKDYADVYVTGGFQVIQVAWNLPGNGFLFQSWRDNTDEPPVKNMKYEGCRPATLLQAIFAKFGGTGGQCAQGHSTGSTAIALALGWYAAGGTQNNGTGAYLDSVLLSSGPPQANIEAGCQYPYQLYTGPIDVCTSGCKFSHAQWSDCVQYANGTRVNCQGIPNSFDSEQAAGSVAGYTNAVAGNCNNYNQNMQSTAAYDANWGAMSLVSTDGTIDYTYPVTSVNAFLCASVDQSSPKHEIYPNNSAGQGWLYLDNIVPTKGTNIYGVDMCYGPEQIWGPHSVVVNGGTSKSGFDQSTQAMMQSCMNNRTSK